MPRNDGRFLKKREEFGTSFSAVCGEVRERSVSPSEPSVGFRRSEAHFRRMPGDAKGSRLSSSFFIWGVGDVGLWARPRLKNHSEPCANASSASVSTHIGRS